MELSHRAIKNTGVILAGQILNLALNLVIMVYLARYLGEVKFGIFSFALVFVGFFAIIADFGIKPIIVREISRDQEKASEIIGHGIVIKFVLAILSILLAYVAAVILHYSNEITIIILILSFTILFSAKLITFRVLFESIFEADLKMEIPILMRLVDSIILTVCVYMLIHMHSTLTMIAILYVVSSIPGFVLIIYRSLMAIKPSFHINIKTLRWIIIESSPLALYVALITVSTSADIFILRIIKGDAEVGYYSAAIRIINPLNFIPAAIVMSLFPLMSKFFANSREKLLKSFKIGVKILLLIGLGFSLTAVFLNKKLILFLYTENYTPSALPFMVLMCAELFSFLNFFLVDFNTSINCQKHNTYAALLMAGVNITTNILLIPIWGVVGASLAKLFTFIVGFLYLYYISYHSIGVSLLPILKNSLPIAFCYSLWLFFADDLNLFLILLISPIVFFVTVTIFRFFSQQEKEIFLNLLKVRLRN